METIVAVIWDKPIVLTRLIEDCGHSCELVTPNLLTAPFFRKSFNGMIIPAGFAVPGSTVVLAALRAISSRIRNYIREGGTLLTFGACFERSNAYDWLPVPVRYTFGFSSSLISGDLTHASSSIIEDVSQPLTIDGIIECSDAQVILSSLNGPVLIIVNYGKGRMIITSLHEYPSRKFIQEFCVGTKGLL